MATDRQESRVRRPPGLANWLPDVAKFARLHVRSGDIDPAYPVLAHILRPGPARLEPADPYWPLMLYAAFYDLGSAMVAWEHHPTPEQLCERCSQLPTGVERRNLRGGGPMRRHIQSILDQRALFGGDIEAWLRPPSSHAEWPDVCWQMVRQVALQPWGNGRWATYKLAELLSAVMGWPIHAPDLGLDGASGPLSGLMMLFGHIDNPEAQAKMLQRKLALDHALVLPLEQLETMLCDFHSLAQGHYYVGHDIDLMQAQILKAEATLQVRARPGLATAAPFDRLWQARSAAFDGRYRGEVSGWTGVDRDRCKAFRDLGLILDRYEPLPLGARLP